MTTHSKAGDNERKFEEIFKKKEREASLLGKQRFTSGEVEISVDQSFKHDGKEYLVEVDSGNMAKVIVGQYVLLNQLKKSRNDTYFLVVHTYKNYNPMRTIHNLSLVNKTLLSGNGIPFGAIHIESLKKWSSGIPELLTLIDSQNP